MKIKIVSMFVRLGLDRPRAWDRLTKLQRIKTNCTERTADVFAEHKGMVFLFRN